MRWINFDVIISATIFARRKSVITCGSSLLLANRVFPFFMLGKADGATGLAFLSYSLQSVTVFIIMKRSQK